MTPAKDYYENCSLAKPAKGLTLSGAIFAFIGMIFWIMLLVQKPNFEQWTKIVGNITVGTSLVCSTLALIFNIVSVIKIKYSTEETPKIYLLFMFISLFCTIMTSVFAGLTNT